MPTTITTEEGTKKEDDQPKETITKEEEEEEENPHHGVAAVAATTVCTTGATATTPSSSSSSSVKVEEVNTSTAADAAVAFLPPSPLPAATGENNSTAGPATASQDENSLNNTSNTKSVDDTVIPVSGGATTKEEEEEEEEATKEQKRKHNNNEKESSQQPTPKKQRRFLTMQEKKSIVEQAYSRERNIKPTAAKYKVQASQIRRWKKSLEKFLTSTTMTEGKKQHMLGLKTLHKGCPRQNNEKYDELKLYYENMKQMGVVVTVGMLVHELQRLTTSKEPLTILQNRVYRWLSNENILRDGRKKIAVAPPAINTTTATLTTTSQSAAISAATTTTTASINNGAATTSTTTPSTDPKSKQSKKSKKKIKAEEAAAAAAAAAERVRQDEATASREFVGYVNRQLAAGHYLATHIVNIDETNLDFSVKPASTPAAAAATSTSAAGSTGESLVVVNEEGTSSIIPTTATSSSSSATTTTTSPTPPNKKQSTFISKVQRAKDQQKIRAEAEANRQRCTVLLGVTMSGHKLPPFIIFRGKSRGRIAREFKGKTTYPKTCKYAVQENAWMDKTRFLEWIDLVWMPYCKDKRTRGTYLIMDEFSVHMMTECTDKLRECGTKIDFIMGGYNEKLQVLDVGNLTERFKGFVKEMHEEFLRCDDKTDSSGAGGAAVVGSSTTDAASEGFDGGTGEGTNTVGPNRKPTRCEVAKWVSDAWEKVDVDSIRNSWSSIGYQAPSVITTNQTVSINQGTAWAI